MIGRYYLGTPEPSWLRLPEFASCPPRDPYRSELRPGIEGALFVSHARLRRLKTHRPAVVPWALDSMGFSMLKQEGRWTISPQEYVDAVMRYEDEIGLLEWCSPQDWMCEELIRKGGVDDSGQVFVGTRKSVVEHQELTVQNFLDLTALYEDQGSRPTPPAVRKTPQDWYGDSPFMPVLQGDPEDPESHLRCAELYESAGVRLSEFPIVGVGSVCRLQDTAAVGRIIQSLSELDILMHGFGVKVEGLRRYGHLLESADSQAWSYGMRRRARLAGCTHRAKACSWCPIAALAWRDRAMKRLVKNCADHGQMELFEEAA